MRLKYLEPLIPPVSFRLDRAIVTIYEVTKSQLINGEKWYHVCLDIRIGKHRSPRFSLDVKDLKDLRRKLLVEISKFKLMIMLGVKL